jgi:hypothetical protein
VVCGKLVEACWVGFALLLQHETKKVCCVKYLYCIAPYLFYTFWFLLKPDVFHHLWRQNWYFYVLLQRAMPISVLDQVNFFVTLDTKYFRHNYTYDHFHYFIAYRKNILYMPITTIRIYCKKLDCYGWSVYSMIFYDRKIKIIILQVYYVLWQPFCNLLIFTQYKAEMLKLGGVSFRKDASRKHI